MLLNASSLSLPRTSIKSTTPSSQRVRSPVTSARSFGTVYERAEKIKSVKGGQKANKYRHADTFFIREEITGVVVQNFRPHSQKSRSKIAKNILEERLTELESITKKQRNAEKNRRKVKAKAGVKHSSSNEFCFSCGIQIREGNDFEHEEDLDETFDLEKIKILHNRDDVFFEESSEGYKISEKINEMNNDAKYERLAKEEAIKGYIVPVTNTHGWPRDKVIARGYSYHL